jgi:hypothetical protein
MTTRAIITSQPDVACEVCERRLLRGEQPDIFLTAGRRRIVCELCAPRAMHEGWRRESEGEALTLPPPRPRRGRNLFERLPVPFRVRQAARPMPEPPAAGEELAYEPDQAPYDPAPQPTYEPDPAPYQAEVPDMRPEVQPYDFLGGLEIVEDRPGTQADGGAPSRSAARFTVASTPPERGIEVFNSSEFPRRIAGIARSLGAPAVNVSQVEDTVGDTVSIIVAWELCWYRYEVDLDVEAPAARLAAQGTELEELARGERVGNTPVDELGVLSAGPAA